MKQPLLPRWPWPADDPRRFKRALTAKDFPQPEPRTCRWRWGPVPAGARTICSPECRHELDLRINTSYLVRKVRERDRGVCAICGADTDRARRILRRCRGMATGKLRWTGESYHLAKRIDAAIESLLRERLNLPARGDGTAPWQADHIIPVSEGGGGCGLENMRTLCLPCHGKETGALRRRLNASRKGQLPLLRHPGPGSVQPPGSTPARTFSEEKGDA